MAECNRCGSEIGAADSCGCGWKRKSMRDRFRETGGNFDLGYQRCEWRTGSDQCRYPGSMSTGGPYFCHLHFGCDDPIFGATVVSASQDYVRETQQQATDRLTEEARCNLAAKGMAKREGESGREYVDRLRAFCRQGFQQINKRMAA